MSRSSERFLYTDYCQLTTRAKIKWFIPQISNITYFDKQPSEKEKEEGERGREQANSLALLIGINKSHSRSLYKDELFSTS